MWTIIDRQRGAKCGQGSMMIARSGCTAPFSAPLVDETGIFPDDFGVVSEPAGLSFSAGSCVSLADWDVARFFSCAFSALRSMGVSTMILVAWFCTSTEVRVSVVAVKAGLGDTPYQSDVIPL
jgi:hypothetical protein